MRDQLISPDDLFLFQVTDSAEQAVKWITRFYRNYHSMRYVRDLLVIRLQHPLTPSAVEGLNEDFADIILGEKIRVTEALPDEVEDRDCVELPRLAFGFDRRQYGRLRQMIDVLNSF